MINYEGMLNLLSDQMDDIALYHNLIIKKICKITNLKALKIIYSFITQF